MGVLLSQLLLEPLFLLLLFCLLQDPLAIATDTLLPGQALTGSTRITSADGVFELGYFSLGNPSRYYVGIRFKEVPIDNVVWVANRDRPLEDSTAEFKISEDGNLVIQTKPKSLFWYTNLTSASSSSSRVAVLLGNGNLVLKDMNSSVLWDTFSHPANTLLPGQNLALDKVTMSSQYLTSWKSSLDPSPGPFTLEYGPNGTAQFVLVWKKTQQYWTTGLWNGQVFGGVPEMGARYLYNFSFFSNETVSYFRYTFNETERLTKLVVDVSGQIKQLVWVKAANQWSVFWAQPRQQCAVYAMCGAFGVCNQDDDKNPCRCLEGFHPALAQDKGLSAWSGGCLRETKLQCKTDQFALLTGIRFTENPNYVIMEIGDKCRSTCLKDCSCTAYSNQSGSCWIWKGDLLNLQQQNDGGGDVIYIRLASLEFTEKQPYTISVGGSSEDRQKKRLIVTIFTTITVVAAFLCAVIGVYSFRSWKAEAIGGTDSQSERPFQPMLLGDEMKENTGPELFDFQVIMAATNNFSESNKLGRGGFGSVYKGKLGGEIEVAVKRLSKGSQQGHQEFMNEVKLIAKLQHRNLVQLLGCCVEGHEKILVYEYMPNKSLNTFLFDEALRRQLDWAKRFEIVMGIARGLQYLHQDSRLRVVHRDLKTSNILLDGEMNPKISDFGLARIFGGDQTQVDTNRVVGTYGYMSPEYALEGRYSTKSDVFSFGVIILEIVSGQKMTNFYDTEHSLNLLGHAWKLWNEEKGLDLLDQSLGWTCHLQQVKRCIHVGLLCIQEDSTDRPTMSSVVLMLSTDSPILLQPKPPVYSYRGKSSKIGSSSLDSEPKSYSTNDFIISLVEAR
ncbi:G-type lectin S-receptor-like serine/threonine-protein kinase At4g27290 [Nymphaea colorata]|nr:G-type lectin S-receptor-like serine/threonine-protein kinase At4g27290 [Nymphaea colorata]